MCHRSGSQAPTPVHSRKAPAMPFLRDRERNLQPSDRRQHQGSDGQLLVKPPTLPKPRQLLARHRILDRRPPRSAPLLHWARSRPLLASRQRWVVTAALASLPLAIQDLGSLLCQALQALLGNPVVLDSNQLLDKLQLLAMHQLLGKLQPRVARPHLARLRHQLSRQRSARPMLWDRRSSQLDSGNRRLDRVPSDKHHRVVQVRRHSGNKHRQTSRHLANSLRKAPNLLRLVK
jgi:hypothetical protein